MEEKVKTFQWRFQKVLAEMPEKLPQVKSYGYKYTPLPIILNTVRPILDKYGLAITQSYTYNEQREEVEVETTIFGNDCAGTKMIKGVLPLTPMKNKTQAVGATITYNRRYQISLLLNLATEEDTDAHVEPSNAEMHDTHTKKLVENDFAKQKEEIKNKLQGALTMNLISEEEYKIRVARMDTIKTEPAMKAYVKAMEKYVASKQPTQDLF